MLPDDDVRLKAMSAEQLRAEGLARMAEAERLDGRGFEHMTLRDYRLFGPFARALDEMNRRAEECDR